MAVDLTSLEAKIGAKAVVAASSEMDRYVHDLMDTSGSVPMAVLRPASTSEVSSAVRWCRQNNLAIVPQGGLTGLCGAAVPVGSRDAAILSLDRMKAIRNVDPMDNTITVDAGVVLADVQAAAERAGRYFPLSHGAQGSSLIGGNVSTNCGGNNAVRYGTARDQVLGLEVVLPDGTIWNGLRRLRKNTAGYDLKQLFIGAEGTLGVVTGVVLKLRPYPHSRATAMVAVPSPEAALTLLRDLETHVGETIAAFELLSDKTVSFALKIENARYPLGSTHPWSVLIEVETPMRDANLKDALEAGLAAGMERGCVVDAVVAQSETQRNAFWFLRESVATYFIEDRSSLKSDTAVPVSNVPDFIANTDAALTASLPGVHNAAFGHLGDGNIHFNVVRPDGMDAAQFRSHRKDLSKVIEAEALKLDGTIAAEHGVGRLKRDSFLNAAEPSERALMGMLKSAIDPDNAMNPGAILHPDDR
ncbi:MAG: FAD-binding oxidoreductase [Alphaproteobacteria bacterium]|nr:FAD-binding oxidoreductase [Alphaproteobacteria bacterium]